MLDIRFVRENPDIVKENIKKKFQDQKLSLVDEVIDLVLSIHPATLAAPKTFDQDAHHELAREAAAAGAVLAFPFSKSLPSAARKYSSPFQPQPTTSSASSRCHRPRSVSYAKRCQASSVSFIET